MYNKTELKQLLEALKHQVNRGAIRLDDLTSDAPWFIFWSETGNDQGFNSYTYYKNEDLIHRYLRLYIYNTFFKNMVA